MNSEILKPVVRWAGSKQRLVPTLVSMAPVKFNRYYEPFAGSAALFFALRPKRATLSDLNPDLINFYRQLKRDYKALHAFVSRLEVTEKNYVCIRSLLNIESDPFRRACYFWFINRTCFNGLYRTNKLGEFNVPFGKKLPMFPTIEHVGRCVARLRRARIGVMDYAKSIEIAQKGDFIYIDPPYGRGSIRDRGEYGIGAMQDDDLPRLISVMEKASNRGVKILFSYNMDVESMLPNWRHEVVNGRYLISADPNKRTLISEFTSRNY